jgi:hypothetical protein
MTFETLVYIIVLVNLTLTIELWRRAARRPEKPDRKLRNRLWKSKPITPKHQPPPPPKEGLFVDDSTLQFFSDFEDFANVVNAWLTQSHAPWRLQELPKSELSSLGIEQPTYGRTYAVFHNQERLGTLEIAPAGLLYYGNKTVLAHIELDWVRLLDFETVRSFLVDIATHVIEYRPGTVDYVRATGEINRAMTFVVWNALTAAWDNFEGPTSYDAPIYVKLTGSAGLYQLHVLDKAAKAGQQKV